MANSPDLYVILLRAIGPVTHKLMGMAQWREAAEKAGFTEPVTVLNTGNMIAGFPGSMGEATRDMTAVLRRFGLGENVVPVLRSPDLLQRLLKADPVPDAARERPSQTGVYFFADASPDFGWLEGYDGPEDVHVVEKHLVVDFTRDVAESGRLIRLIDKSCGTNTSRSWSSVTKIAAAAAEHPHPASP
ncbi:Uncharacterized conserved protein, DUF1697 family [Devosia lucknowensis]|uniref:Uncharacterized conserved protein, DUF1697 family n=1 Tax=Devosia lucknowensis TaxID=1096929 RepID=A0A1Y6ENW1_9HYPH|nr:DUF1697 domain-containing protein [Devosia lucknowensis]SMQ62212.1 Uncharacterized conserved protein, DUF1697 family [Devosia lucknowensis]